MNRPRLMTSLRASLFAALTCACAATGGDEPTAADVTPIEDAEAAAPVTRITVDRSVAELEVWQDPTFERWFAESYAAVSEVEPVVTSTEQDLIQSVYAQLEAGALEDVVQRLDAQRGEGSSATLDYVIGNAYLEQDQLDEAAAAYERAVAAYPRFLRAWRNLALVRVQGGDHEGAIEAFTRAMSYGDASAVTYGLLGVAYSNTSNDLAAETAFRMAMLMDASTLDWKMGLARSLFRQQRFPEAVALCDTLIAERPDSAQAWTLQASAYIGMGETLEAAENYEFIDRLGAATGEHLLNLADIYINEEVFDLGVNAYTRAMAQAEPGQVTRPLRAAQVLIGRGALGEGTRLLDAIEDTHGEALGEDDHKDVLRLRARLAVAAGASDEEARVLEEIVALDPLDGEALILLGQHAARHERPEQAIFYYERAAALEEFEADAKVRHAQLLVGQGQDKSALALLRRAQELEPRASIQEFLEQVERRANGR